MKCFVIVLKDNSNAERQFQRCIESGNRHGWKIERFDAILGSSLTEKDFIAEGLYIRPGTKVSTRPGALGCFMSHWTLWKQCLQDNEDYIILESDAVINGPLPKLDLSNYLIKLHLDTGTNHSEVSGQWSKRAHAYALTPSHAKTLIDSARAKHVKPVDVFIGDQIVPWKHYDYNLVVHSQLGGSTTSGQRFGFLTN